MDGVKDPDLVAVENAPNGTKSISSFVWGLLKAQVNASNIKSLFKFLSDRFGNKPIVILDCCFSGAFSKGLTPKDTGSINEKIG